MPRLIQHLWFDSDMMAAIETYVAAIPDSHLDWTSVLPADSPAGPAGTMKLAGFTLGGVPYQAFEAGAHHGFNDAFSIMVECEDQATLDRIWAALLAGGGKEVACGWLNDRWGLRWQIVPKRLGELMSDPDPARARRTAEAMMTQVKFDIAALEAAADG